MLVVRTPLGATRKKPPLNFDSDGRAKWPVLAVVMGTPMVMPVVLVESVAAEAPPRVMALVFCRALTLPRLRVPALIVVAPE